MCMTTHCLIVLWNCIKFQPNSFNSVQLTEGTKCIWLCYKGNNFKNTHAKVMVLKHATSSECALQMCEVSLKYLLRLSSYRADTNSIATDQREITPKLSKAVMVLVHDTLSECAL